ncbi:MAG: hypothetical protein ACI4TQ_00525, partial [Alloprevotella sp.]
MLSNKEFRASARQALTNNWGTAVAVSFVFICTYIFLSLIASIPDFLGDAIDKIIPRYSGEEVLVNILSASSIMLDLLSLIFDILLFPMEWGISILFLGFYRGGSLTFEGLFAGFTGGRYGRTLYTYFLNFVRVLL